MPAAQAGKEGGGAIGIADADIDVFEMRAGHGFFPTPNWNKYALDLMQSQADLRSS
jgi:hypothetical protein